MKLIFPLPVPEETIHFVHLYHKSGLSDVLTGLLTSQRTTTETHKTAEQRQKHASFTWKDQTQGNAKKKKKGNKSRITCSRRGKKQALRLKVRFVNGAVQKDNH